MESVTYCGACQLQDCSSPECVALLVLAKVADMTGPEHETYPGMLENERAQLTWDFRKRWHEARGLAFAEPPPKPKAERELDALFLLNWTEESKRGVA